MANNKIGTYKDASDFHYYRARDRDNDYSFHPSDEGMNPGSWGGYTGNPIEDYDMPSSLGLLSSISRGAEGLEDDFLNRRQALPERYDDDYDIYDPQNKESWMKTYWDNYMDRGQAHSPDMGGLFQFLNTSR